MSRTEKKDNPVDKIIEESIKIEQTITSAFDDPDRLSFGIAALGSCYSRLGKYLVMAERDLSVMEASLEIEEAKEKKRLTSSKDKDKRLAVNKAEIEIELDERFQKMRLEIIDKKYSVSLIKVKRNDMKTEIDAYRSRLAFIREEVN